ncbi:uncharacterized protein LOC111484139 isoform X2 [Cucurbita maxima]|uniref:Uncharacterized protein LOC111484139 isoform X2 n=1 Tax=Cucurbita maxima TaxID=3661 RepID=A0A6J1JGC9_CUCMA|nr:uncharacterized protein LOC111484139 isoform X2 [Cucurbita maxima]
MLLFPFVHFFLVIALCSMHSIHLLCRIVSVQGWSTSVSDNKGFKEEVVMVRCSIIKALGQFQSKYIVQSSSRLFSYDNGNWCQLTAEEGETSKPSTRIATISKSGEWVAQDAQFEKVELQTALPKQRENYKKEIPKEASCSRAKQRTVSLKINCKNTFSSSETHTAQEPQLPPKDGKNEFLCRD